MPYNAIAKTDLDGARAQTNPVAFLRRIVRGIVDSRHNPWGTAALKEIGTQQGDILALGPGGKLRQADVPAASETVAGMHERWRRPSDLRAAGALEVTDRAVTKADMDAYLLTRTTDPDATETTRGIAEFATPAELVARSDATRFVRERDLGFLYGRPGAFAKRSRLKITPLYTGDGVNVNDDASANVTLTADWTSGRPVIAHVDAAGVTWAGLYLASGESGVLYPLDDIATGAARNTSGVVLDSEDNRITMTRSTSRLATIGFISRIRSVPTFANRVVPVNASITGSPAFRVGTRWEFSVIGTGNTRNAGVHFYYFANPARFGGGWMFLSGQTTDQIGITSQSPDWRGIFTDVFGSNLVYVPGFSFDRRVGAILQTQPTTTFLNDLKSRLETSLLERRGLDDTDVYRLTQGFPRSTDQRLIDFRSPYALRVVAASVPTPTKSHTHATLRGLWQIENEAF